MKQDVIIVGAGLAGLAAAVHLYRQGQKVLLLEATDRPGGRIKTDLHEGYLLDRGFQVLLTAYPETQTLLNYTDLNLKKMLPGATVLYDGGIFEIADPFRRPSAAFATLFAPVGSLKDKINTLWLKTCFSTLLISVLLTVLLAVIHPAFSFFLALHQQQIVFMKFAFISYYNFLSIFSTLNSI